MARKILLVEDNELFRGMLRSLLEMRNYTVVVTGSGPEALARVAAEEFDAVLTDIEMPEMDGFEFCRQLHVQQQAAGHDLPVWIMTGMFRPGLAKKAAAAGALFVLRKPFPIEEVCEHLEREFAKRGSAARPDKPGASPASPPPAR